MAFLQINPRYRDFLSAQGLTEARDFLDLKGVVVSGHASRHVMRVRLGQGARTVDAFIKREHWVRWRDRFASLRAGFGWASKSAREAAVLNRLSRAGVLCPGWLAWGEDDRGRAFLLLEEVSGACELRAALERLRSAPASARLDLARALGEAVGRMHAAGFSHRDLYAKHLLVVPKRGPDFDGDLEIWFLDWQCSRQRRPECWRDLASLDATVAGTLADPRERLTCLRSYFLASGSQPTRLTQAARMIRAEASRLLANRRVEEQRQPLLPLGSQSLVWVDGEKMCLTREFHESLGGIGSRWLEQACALVGGHGGSNHEVIGLPCGRRGRLTCRHASRPLAWLWAGLRGRRLTSPELQRAGVLFRLQRHGVASPRVLGFGQSSPRPWVTDSFLLTLESTDVRSVATWLASCANAGAGRRRGVLPRQLAALLCRVHEAHYTTGAARVAAFEISAGSARVAMKGIESARRIARPMHERRRDALAFGRSLRAAGFGRADQLRFALAYLRESRLSSENKAMVRQMIGLSPSMQLSPGNPLRRVSSWITMVATGIGRMAFRRAPALGQEG